MCFTKALVYGLLRPLPSSAVRPAWVEKEIIVPRGASILLRPRPVEAPLVLDLFRLSVSGLSRQASRTSIRKFFACCRSVRMSSTLTNLFRIRFVVKLCVYRHEIVYAVELHRVTTIIE